MTDLADAHQGRIYLVNDARGYTIGRSSDCTCGWESHELRDRESQALLDHFQHLQDMDIRPKERCP